MTHRTRNVLVVLAVAAALQVPVPEAQDRAGAGGHAAEAPPPVDPARFTMAVDHPLLPLRPEARWVYEGPTPKGAKRVVVEVTGDRRSVMGVPCVVVRDTVSVAGTVVEDTLAWYAQDRDGNVWNFGQEARVEEGRALRTQGHWEAGVDGARPGIAMPAHPKVGDRYRQQYAAGEAEDVGQVLSVRQRASVRAGDFDVVVIKSSSRLDPGSSTDTFYAPGVGPVLEISVEGNGDWVELVERTVP